ncbi:MAG: molybdopterin cofactor-binding domain-containing protein, partial [Pseudomonadota bacterium]
APPVRPEGNLYMYDGRPCRRVVLGDIEAGFKEADEVVSGQYIHPSLEHTAMETQTSLVVPSAEGKLTIYTVSAAHYFHLMMISRILQLPMNKVRYVGGTVGGSFGAKTDIHADHITSLLALKTGRPVKWAWTREEELLYSTHRGVWHITIEDGVKRDGRLIARKIKSIRDAGAYSSLNAYVVDKHCFHAAGPYFIPNVYVEGYCVYTNKPPASAMRGFGLTPAVYVAEVQMNKIAARLGMDPWEIRFINAYRNGDYMPTRRVLDSVALIETMQALARKAGLKLPERLMAMTSEKRRKSP